MSAHPNPTPKRKRIVIKGEEFPLPAMDDCDMGEMFLLEQVTGLRGQSLIDCINEGSVGALVAIAIITLRRAGRTITIEEAFRFKPDDIEPKKDEDEAEDPPPSPTSSGAASAEVPPATSSETPQPEPGVPSTETPAT